MRAAQKIYKHITIEERVEIYAQWKQGLTLRSIARSVGRDVGTISREIKRNRTRYTKEYTPVKAHEIAIKRRIKQRTKAPLKNVQIWLYVREKLRRGWSPEIIEGRLPIDHPGEYISYETIYQYIYGKGRRHKLHRFLVRARKRRMEKTGRSVRRDSKIPDAISIDKRPYQINKRVSVGHLESDNMVGRTRDITALSVTVDRLLRTTYLSKVTKKTESKVTGLIYRLGVVPQYLRKTVTVDNGAENTNHNDIKRLLNMNVYFCHPYHSWEKGTVENMIGRIRRYIPKGVSIDEIPEEYIREIENQLNSTPRKCLGYLTPNEMKLQIKHGRIP